MISVTCPDCNSWLNKISIDNSICVKCGKPFNHVIYRNTENGLEIKESLLPDITFIAVFDIGVTKKNQYSSNTLRANK